MTLDPQLVIAALDSWPDGCTRCPSPGSKKHGLELKRRSGSAPRAAVASTAPPATPLIRSKPRPTSPTVQERRPRRVVDERDVAELAARARLLAVEVKVRARDREHGLAAAARSPIRFTIAAPPRSVGRPSGSPRIARRWFSNWLVAAPSIVQCPELWTRGAISFASSWPSDVEELEREHADVVERVEQPRGVVLGLAPAARRQPAHATCGGCRRRGRSRPAGRRRSRRRARGRRASTARGRTGRTLEDVAGVRPRPGLHQALALAVVAEPARLQRAPGTVSTSSSMRGGRDPEPAEEPSRRADPAPPRARRAPGTAPTRRAASTGTFSNS